MKAGVILFCKATRFLQSRIHLDEQRVRNLSTSVDIDEARDQLGVIPRICAGGSEAGPLGQESQSARFHWLTSRKTPSSKHLPYTADCVTPRLRNWMNCLRSWFCQTDLSRPPLVVIGLFKLIQPYGAMRAKEERMRPVKVLKQSLESE